MTNWQWAYPPSTVQALDAYHRQCEHIGLLLDKFAPYAAYEWQAWKNGREEFHREWRLGYVTVDERWDSRRDVRNDKVTETQKGDWLQYLIDLKPRFNADLAKRQRERWEAMCAAYIGGTTFSMRTAARLIVGLGSEHVLETAITLDRNSGLPIIPGTALKGLTRTVALIEIAKVLLANVADPLECLNKLDDWLAQGTKWDELAKITGATSDEDAKTQFETGVNEFRECFGYRDRAGDLVFSDAVYAGSAAPRFEVDIMNPHFGKYYIEGQAPAEDAEPKPVTYLTVAPQQEFRFAVLPRRPELTTWVETGVERLKTGLTQYGVGAKTNQGYGLFAWDQMETT